MDDDSEVENWVFVDQNDCLEQKSTPGVSDEESDGSISIISANTYLEEHAPVKEIVTSEANSEACSQITPKIILEEQESDESIIILSPYSEEGPAVNEEIVYPATYVEDNSEATSQVAMETQESDSSISVLSYCSEEEAANQENIYLNTDETDPDLEPVNSDLMLIPQQSWSPDKSALEVCDRLCRFRGSRPPILEPILSERTPESDRSKKPQSAANGPALSIVIFAVPMLMCMLVMLVIRPSFDLKKDRPLPPTNPPCEDNLNRCTENADSLNCRARGFLDTITKDPEFKRYLENCNRFYGKRYEKMCTILFLFEKTDGREYYWILHELMRYDESIAESFFTELGLPKDASSQKGKFFFSVFKTTLSLLSKLKATFQRFDFGKMIVFSTDAKKGCLKTYSRDMAYRNKNENRYLKYCRLVGDSLKDMKKLYDKLLSIEIAYGYKKKRKAKFFSTENMHLKYPQVNDSFKLANTARLPKEDSVVIKNGSKKVNGKWYFSLYGDARSDFRKKGEAAEWYFKRAQYRKKQRHFDYISGKERKNSWRTGKYN